MILSPRNAFGLAWVTAVWMMAGCLPAQSVAPQMCASCHPEQAKHSRSNRMANALLRPEESAILRTNPDLEFSEGKYRTRIARENTGSTLTITDGTDTLQAPIQWAFGLGSAGQTYVFAHQGQLFESRVSYYNERRGLDLTMGAQGAKPATLIEAAGRRMDQTDVRECFGCHSTGGKRKDGVDWDAMTPGVLCESCHGNGSRHVKTRRDGNRTAFPMRKLGLLSAEETNELCGACHRTWAQIAEMKLRGPLNVRFQPYRITNSKCFDAEDRRIGCTACHDPHGELVSAPAAYDGKCLACHPQSASAKKASLKSGKFCHTGTTGCVTCHMPKVALPGAHFDFTDHQIRISRAGEPYPN